MFISVGFYKAANMFPLLDETAFSVRVYKKMHETWSCNQADSIVHRLIHKPSTRGQTGFVEAPLAKARVLKKKYSIGSALNLSQEMSFSQGLRVHLVG